MIKILSSCLGLLVCTDLILSRTSAHMKHTLDEYLGEDKVTHMTKKQNYIRQKALENDDVLNRNLGVAYTVESFEPDTNSDELPPLIVDYANMMRNDFILLDNSVQTRTRKRGINKVEKSQALMDPPCSCEDRKVMTPLGEQFFPPYIWTTECKPALCRPDFRCEMNNYNLTVLKKSDMNQRSTFPLPKEFMPAVLEGWIAVSIPVTVGCMCTAADDLH